MQEKLFLNATFVSHDRAFGDTEFCVQFHHQIGQCADGQRMSVRAGFERQPMYVITTAYDAVLWSFFDKSSLRQPWTKWVLPVMVLGRTYRDLHRTIEQLGCGAGQEGDGLGEAAPGIPIITTLPRSRHGDYFYFLLYSGYSKLYTVFFS